MLQPLLAVALLLFLASVDCSLGQLPTGWSDIDIGSPAEAGSASLAADIWTVSGSGADIWNSADQFNFACESSSAYAVAVAQVLTVEYTDPWAKAGVMFRDDATPGSMFATVEATPGNGVNFQWRNAPGGQCGNSEVGGISAPAPTSPGTAVSTEQRG
jgi:hypothetical protein